jgi:hypothetical protein
MEYYVYNKHLMITKQNYLYFTCSATLLTFLFGLLTSSVAMHEQMLHGKGFLVLGYLLEKVSDMYWWCYCVAFIGEQLTISNWIFVTSLSIHGIIVIDC